MVIGVPGSYASFAQQFAYPKIKKFYVASCRNQNIARFDISMDDQSAMGVFNGVAYFDYQG
jgi:hypothetical protein